VRTLFVVILPPGFDLSSCVTQTGKPVRVQAFIAQGTVSVPVAEGVLADVCRWLKGGGDAFALLHLGLTSRFRGEDFLLGLS